MDKEEENIVKEPSKDENSLFGRIKRSGSIMTDGDMLIKMFNRNEKGFVKNKEMKINQRKAIFGLNAVPQKDGASLTAEESAMNRGPAYDVLYGETMKKIIKNIWCQHNFNPTYLKNTTNASSRNQEYSKSLKTF